jgi:hypothetical protein
MGALVVVDRQGQGRGANKTGARPFDLDRRRLPLGPGETCAKSILCALFSFARRT